VLIVVATKLRRPGGDCRLRHVSLPTRSGFFAPYGCRRCGIRTWLIRLCVLGTLGLSAATSAQAPTDPSVVSASAPQPGFASEDTPAPNSSEAPSQGAKVWTDIKLYFSSPLRWDATDWTWFGGALLAIGASHHYDTQVRSHFVKNLAPGQTISTDDVQDALPTIGVLVATWGAANLFDDNDGRHEAWMMLEAAGLSTVTAYGFKYVSRREGPDQTSDADEWFKSGGKSFPSEHSTAAFAVGTVLAESGNDDLRWLRRLLGYGLGIATSYERLRHNAHWLSDTVAGSALGIASANFTMRRTSRMDEETGSSSSLSVLPVPGGAMLTYRVTLR
jgi:membrane-associated phospholipid phosphatase